MRGMMAFEPAQRLTAEQLLKSEYIMKWAMPALGRGNVRDRGEAAWNKECLGLYHRLNGIRHPVHSTIHKFGIKFIFPLNHANSGNIQHAK